MLENSGLKEVSGFGNYDIFDSKSKSRIQNPKSQIPRQNRRAWPKLNESCLQLTIYVFIIAVAAGFYGY